MSPLWQFRSVAAFGLLGLLAAAAYLFRPTDTFAVSAGCAIYLAGTLLAQVPFQRSYAHPSLGFCNTVTVFRLALVGLLFAALIAQSLNPWALVAIAALALSMDGVDGWLARYEGLASGFGARFDMEVDSALALTLALHGVFTAGIGYHVLLLGLPRYIFMAAEFAFPWLGDPLPPRFSRKLVCVLQLGVLILVLVPLFPVGLANALVGVVALALIWSFWTDVAWLRRSHA